MIAGFVTLIWCFTLLCGSLLVRTPVASLFAEIDLVSKAASERDPFIELVSSLNGAESSKIRRTMASERLQVLPADDLPEKGERPIITLKTRG